MMFLEPLLLLVLLTLPVILVLHLLRERRQRTVVPSLLHWLNVPRRREGLRMRRLPLTLLLLLHLLVAGLLGLALGRPQLVGSPGSGAQEIALVLDISTSMAARDGAATRFTEAQQRARSLLRALGEEDRAILITAGPGARIVASGGAADLPTLDAALNELRPGGTGSDLAGALTLAQAALDPQRSRRIVIISDGALPPGPVAPPAVPVEWEQIGRDAPNRAIIAFAVRPWGANLQVYARVANYSASPFATTLWLYGDEQPIGTRDVTIAADGETELTWTLRNEFATLRAEIDGRDALPLDDQAYVSAVILRSLNVLLVSSTPDPLRRALEALPGVRLSVVDPARYDAGVGQAADLTIFNGFLPEQWPAGAVLIVYPPPDNPLLEVEGRYRPDHNDTLEGQGPVLEGLSLDGVDFGEVRQVMPPTWAETQLAIGDVPLILRGSDGVRQIAVWTFDPSVGNLATRLAFPLLVSRTVRDLAPDALPAALPSGAALAWRPDSRADEIRLVGPDGVQANIDVAPALQSLDHPGFYRVEERDDGRLLYASSIGVNAGSALESDLRPRSIPLLSHAVEAPDDTVRQRAIDLWPWLALGAIVVLFLEWMYIHR
ncbi:MAG: VWA domain-containing protein [Herpetosiphonaceae bacterium]|nr:MAG: VWA domain-containing protein [Herpetosiphonaceae bacterium]